MRYPNAIRGLRLLLISQCIRLGLALLQALLSLVLSLMNVRYVFYQVYSWIFSFFSLAPLVLMLLGILQARRDEEAFRPALVPVCVLLGGNFVFNVLLSLWAGAFSSNVMLWVYLAYLFASVLLYLWVWISMTDGVIALARDNRAEGLVRFGKLLLWVLPIACVPSLAHNGLLILGQTGAEFYLNNEETLYGLRNVLSYVSTGFNYVRLVLLLILLIRALVMLKRVRAVEADPAYGL